MFPRAAEEASTSAWTSFEVNGCLTSVNPASQNRSPATGIWYRHLFSSVAAATASTSLPAMFSGTPPATLIAQIGCS